MRRQSEFLAVLGNRTLVTLFGAMVAEFCEQGRTEFTYRDLVVVGKEVARRGLTSAPEPADERVHV